MKTRSLPGLALTLTTVAAVTFLAAKAAGQDSSTSTPAATQPAAASQAAPQLSYGVSEVVQLAHANVGEDVIVNYIQNSGNAYGLDANQILYLKQQGVSDRIVNTMLDQRGRVAAAVQTAPQANSTDANSSQTAATTAQPTVTYVQPAPSSTVYVIPDTQTYNYYAYSYPYYPYYGYYGWPRVSFSFGYGGYYGGYRGGWHGGGGWHNSGGWHGGGGFHGGGGGFHGGGGSHGGGHR